jgi:hypothetical protein
VKVLILLAGETLPAFIEKSTILELDEKKDRSRDISSHQRDRIPHMVVRCVWVSVSQEVNIPATCLVYPMRSIEAQASPSPIIM